MHMSNTVSLPGFSFFASCALLCYLVRAWVPLWLPWYQRQCLSGSTVTAMCCPCDCTVHTYVLTCFQLKLICSHDTFHPYTRIYFGLRSSCISAHVSVCIMLWHDDSCLSSGQLFGSCSHDCELATSMQGLPAAGKHITSHVQLDAHYPAIGTYWTQHLCSELSDTPP